MLTCNRSPFELFDPTFTGTLPSPFVLACPEFVTSFFSHSCKTLPPQPLCFDNHLDCGGGWGCPSHENPSHLPCFHQLTNLYREPPGWEGRLQAHPGCTQTTATS